MEHEFTDTILALIGKLDHIDAIGTFDKLDEDLWGRTGGDTWQELADNLPALVDHLKGEYHQEHKIDPQIDCLRESLQEVITTIEKACQDKPDTVYYDFCRMKYLCADWIKWIDRYFPPDPNGQEPKSKQTRPKKQSKAAARLQSQELQEVKAKLIAAGIINDDGWQGTPAEFGCLVNELRDERGINDHGRRAWKEVARWAEYHGNIESARSAIEKHIDTEGDVADKIRAICLSNK